MPNSHEERFERIERNLEQITGAIKGLIAQAESNQKAVGSLVESVAAFTASVNAYVIDSRERTKRLEENLDALIRAITLEHGNGRKPK
jgi:septation ring formation regulator EzrA